MDNSFLLRAEDELGSIRGCLKKAKSLNEDIDQYFCYRDTETAELSDEQKMEILWAYSAIGLKTDMQDDYVYQAMQKVEALEEKLREKRLEERQND